MPIPITRRAKRLERREDIEKQELDAFGAVYPKASYADKRESLRVLCGSIKLLLPGER